MKLLLAGSSPEVPADLAGDVTFDVAGRWIRRQKVSGVDPYTSYQSRERGGITSGSKIWAYDLTDAEIDSWNSCSVFGLSGWDLWHWLWSLLQFSFPTSLPGGTTCSGPADPVCDMFCFDSGEGIGLISTIDLGYSATTRIVVHASRPMKPGRFPRIEDSRVVGSVQPGVVFDVLAAVIARFGESWLARSFPGCWLRAVDPSTRTASAFTMVSTEDESCSSSGDCSVSPSTASISAFGSLNIEMRIDSADSDPAETFSVDVQPSAAWSIDPPAAMNHTTTPATLTDTSGTPRTETVIFTFTSVSDPTVQCFCSARITVS